MSYRVRGAYNSPKNTALPSNLGCIGKKRNNILRNQEGAIIVGDSRHDSYLYININTYIEYLQYFGKINRG